MDFDDESLLDAFCEDPEKAEVKQWTIEQCKERNADNGRSAIFEHRLERGDALREEGNEFVKQDDLVQARQRYLAAIWQLDFNLGQEWDAMPKYRRDLDMKKLKVISNIAVIHRKNKDWYNAKVAAETGLKHLTEKTRLEGEDRTGYEAKFLYLKGVANLERGFSEDAVENLRKAVALSPNDKQVRELLDRATETRSKDKQDAKEVWKSKLLTEEERAMQGTWWYFSTQWARCKRRCRGGPPPTPLTAEEKKALEEEHAKEAAARRVRVNSATRARYHSDSLRRRTRNRAF